MALKVVDADVGANSGALNGVFSIVDNRIEADVTPKTTFEKPPFVVDRKTGEALKCVSFSQLSHTVLSEQTRLELED